MSKVIFVGGGSIGHIAPAVAVARALIGIKKEAEAVFVCSSRKDDSAFLEMEGFNFRQIEAPRIGLGFPLKFLRAYKTAKKILAEEKPDVIFSKGGYVSVPVCLAAKRMNIPIILHESDAVMGRANRIISKWASRVCLGFPIKRETRNQPSFVSGELRPAGEQRTTLTGTPLRPQITQGSSEEGKRIAGFSNSNKPVLLVIGGSQGSRALNEFVIKNIDKLVEKYNVIHITGYGKVGCGNSEKSKPGAPVLGCGRYFQTEFAGDELAHFYAAADIAISRAGANTIAELAANNIPAILVPLRGIAHNHQIANARVASALGNFEIVNQDKINKELVEKLKSIQTKNQTSNEQPAFVRQRRTTAGRRATSNLFSPAPALQIAKIICDCLAHSEKHH